MVNNKRLTTEISQNGDSCLIISFIIIFNYYSNKTSDELFNYFLDKNDGLFNTYGIDKSGMDTMVSEEKYLYLYGNVANKTEGALQFNNSYLLNSFQDLTKSHGVETRLVDFEMDVEFIANVLKQKEAFVSVTLHKGTDVHVVPVGFDNEFYAIDKGKAISIGENLQQIRTIYNVDRLGDGILFIRS